MIEETRNDQEATRKDIFLSWMSEIEGKFWPDEDKMSKAMAGILKEYLHLRRNFPPNDARVIKASQALQNITGYSAEEFYDFRENLNKDK